MKRLLICDNDPGAGTWYRGVAAIECFRKQYSKEFSTAVKRNGVNEDDLHQSDGLFYFRPCYIPDAAILETATQLGIKTCFDWDDSMLDIPYSHPDYPTWSNEALLDSWTNCMRKSSIVTTTTMALVDKYKVITGKNNVFLVPNAINDQIFPCATKPKMGMVPRMVIWRGGKTHSDDLISFKEVFRQLQLDGVRIIFFGSVHPYVVREVLIDGMWGYVPGVSPVSQYWKMLAEINAPVHVIPLVENEFNRCKSNLAWIEGSYIGGSVCVQPEFYNADLEDREGTAVTYSSKNTPDEIATSILNLLDDEGLRERIVAKAQLKIRENYLSSVVNEYRYNLFTTHLF